jgi:flagella basal body P-ring formation protein FlgA
MALRHNVAAGSPMPLADLGHPVLVHKNSAVVMVLDAPGLSLTAQGIAAEDGGRGELIRVVNPASRAVVTAEVTGPDRVRVTGGQPTILAPGASVPARLAAR